MARYYDENTMFRAALVAGVRLSVFLAVLKQNADVVDIVRCAECVNSGNCYPETVFRQTGVKNPYCCAGKRKEGDECSM